MCVVHDEMVLPGNEDGYQHIDQDHDHDDHDEMVFPGEQQDGQMIVLMKRQMRFTSHRMG